MRLFSLQEVENQPMLQLFLGAIFLGYLIRLNGLLPRAGTTIEAVTDHTYVCWPFFQGCDALHWLSTLPVGYSQPLVFMLAFGTLIFGSYAILTRRWVLAHACLFIVFIFKLYLMAADYTVKGNYDYYQFIFSFIFLFLPHKTFFAQLSVVLFYFISTSAKIHPSWTLGSYFTAMKTGLPIFPYGSEIIMTNLVIAMEMLASWFLFSPTRWLQRTVLTFFIIFHLYSGLLVSYLYPTIVLPSLVILFGPLFKPWKDIPRDRKAIAGWVMVLLVLLCQASPKMIAGDEKLTMEGNYYGLYMFEANHQCQSQILLNGKVLQTFTRTSARQRCDPYQYWFRLSHMYCLPGATNHYQFIFDHSINGQTFKRIIDEPDLCALRYKPFSHNDWIKTDDAPEVGRARQNYYR